MYAQKLLLDEVFGFHVAFYFGVSCGRELCFGNGSTSSLDDMTTQRCRAVCGKLVWLAHVLLGCDDVAALALCSSGRHGTNTTHCTGKVAHLNLRTQELLLVLFLFTSCEMPTTVSS